MSKTPSHLKAFERIINKNEARKFLHDSTKTTVLTTLWTHNQEILYQGFISQMDDRQKCFYFEANGPQNTSTITSSGEAKLPTGICFFSVALGEAHLFFRAEFKGNTPKGLQFETPEDVYKVQRRKSMRVSIPKGYDITADLYFANSNPIQKHVFDISEGGASVVVSLDEQDTYKVGTKISKIKIRIRQKDIWTDGQIRYLKELVHHPRHQGVKVGIQFGHLKKEDLDHIQLFLGEENRKSFSKMF